MVAMICAQQQETTTRTSIRQHGHLRQSDEHGTGLSSRFLPLCDHVALILLGPSIMSGCCIACWASYCSCSCLITLWFLRGLIIFWSNHLINDSSSVLIP